MPHTFARHQMRSRVGVRLAPESDCLIYLNSNTHEAVSLRARESQDASLTAPDMRHQPH
jgi:hypothetical protein